MKKRPDLLTILFKNAKINKDHVLAGYQFEKAHYENLRISSYVPDKIFSNTTKHIIPISNIRLRINQIKSNHRQVLEYVIINGYSLVAIGKMAGKHSKTARYKRGLAIFIDALEDLVNHLG